MLSFASGAIPAAPPRPVVANYARAEMAMAEAEESGRVMAGNTTSAVSVQVDFALVPK